jgi:adenosylcobyric acid synthase
LIDEHRRGATVIGICGGYQMLGRTIDDPAAMESQAGRVTGLGLLPADTTMTREKRTRAVSATTDGGAVFGGYEIHLGETQIDDRGDQRPFARLDDGSVDGVRAEKLIGTYLHGAFEDPNVCAEIFAIDPPSSRPKADHYRQLAAWFGRHARNTDRLGLD